MYFCMARFNAAAAAASSPVATTSASDEAKPKRTRRKKQHRTMKEGAHNTGIHKICSLSPELSNIVGSPKASRVDVNKKVWGWQGA
mmetsp:Transcript_5838/g.5008  ORF Transcript_5838/g.5008 Transcript_5838/m.5008 type:complete len:86 (+) Transcript_5838:3-260(+)